MDMELFPHLVSSNILPFLAFLNILPFSHLMAPQLLRHLHQQIGNNSHSNNKVNTQVSNRSNIQASNSRHKGNTSSSLFNPQQQQGQQQQSQQFNNNNSQQHVSVKGPPVPPKPSRGQSQHITMPEVPNVFPELDKLTDAQLERILSDDMAFRANLNTIMPLDSIRSLRDQMRVTNSENASKNLMLGEDISTYQSQAEALQAQFNIASTQYTQKLTEVSKRFEVNQSDVIKE
eukprot:gene31015-38333_t